MRLRSWLAAAGLALLAACGGDDDYGSAPASCDVVSRQTWLRDYFNDWYYWYALSPYPTPGSLPTVDEYFQALLYTGTDPRFPADRWSFYQSTESFNRYFGDGQTLGYGIFVAGLEVTGQPAQPLYVRYVEPASPAAGNVLRGDRIVSINGRLASDMIANDDFSVLTPNQAGEVIRVELVDTVGQAFTFDITAKIYSLTPVPPALTSVVRSPAGRQMGYLMVKDMISQASRPLSRAFELFAAQGASELVIDVRYNGGGLVSMGAEIASYVNPARTAGQVYASLLYNDKQAGNNRDFRFDRPFNALNLTRVYVLTGPRTCSAAEQIINALRPFVEVVAIGDTTCGKPVGFLPADDGCGDTHSVVNFESVNARNEGRFFDGFNPSCTVAEDFTQALGAPAEPLLAAAVAHADGVDCSALAASTRERPMASRLRDWTRRSSEGERPAMIPR
jgi:hypothetical protein